MKRHQIEELAYIFAQIGHHTESLVNYNKMLQELVTTLCQETAEEKQPPCPECQT